MMFTHIVKLMRPLQWVKNFFVFAPLLFAFRFTDLAAWSSAIIAALSFAFLSSAVYIFNDIKDVNEDRNHPRKKKRPIASGKVSLQIAYLLIALLVTLSVWAANHLPFESQIVLITYLTLQLFYTIKLKHVAIIDAMVIASGFVLRVLVGGYAISVEISPWIILTTYLLALFLGFGKRYNELSVAGYKKSRSSLNSYNKNFLESLIVISCFTTMISYAIYTVETANELGSNNLVYTMVFVIFGLFRYLQILYVEGKGGEPEIILFREKLFFVNCLMWLVSTLLILK